MIEYIESLSWVQIIVFFVCVVVIIDVTGDIIEALRKK